MVNLKTGREEVTDSDAIRGMGVGEDDHLRTKEKKGGGLEGRCEARAEREEGC